MSTSMKKMYFALLASACSLGSGFPQAAANEADFVTAPVVLHADQSTASAPAPVRMASADRPNMGGGFIEFLFGDGQGQGYQSQSQLDRQRPLYPQQQTYQQPSMMVPQQTMQQPMMGEPARPAFDPKYEKQVVDYDGKESAGTVVVDTPNKFLYLVEGNGKAMRYGIGVGREGFTWAGAERVSRMAEWPDWHPPAEMIERQPYLPRFMAGGEGNPLGARALYLGKTLYRIHGTNQPSTIGTFVSSGCIRLTNRDIMDLYTRVKVGSRVVVLPARPPTTAAVSTAGPARFRLVPPSEILWSSGKPEATSGLFVR
jgi:lipoprotein-anchoring transpeptidase ErfK/SrfK